MAAPLPGLNLCENLHDSGDKSNGVVVPAITFDCSICLEVPHDPVVTMCGHLFCWSCLHQWITIRPIFQECPVCKACVENKIIPLYGGGRVLGCARNNDTKTKHTFKAPPRPSQQQRQIPTVDAPGSTGRHQQSVISHQSYGYRGGHPMQSATASGVVPALFGIHMLTSPEYSGTFNSAPSGLLSVGATALQDQRRSSLAQHEPLLFWLLFLLGCLVSVCSLLFL